MKAKNILLIVLSLISLLLIVDDARLRISINHLNSSLENNLNKPEIEEEAPKNIPSELIENNNPEVRTIEQSAQFSNSLNQLKRKGLNNPIENLCDDLMMHQELIPDKETSKGTMHFIKEEIYLVNSKWVYAYYEDGHFAGELIAAFDVNEDGEITWKVIDSLR